MNQEQDLDEADHREGAEHAISFPNVFSGRPRHLGERYLVRHTTRLYNLLVCFFRQLRGEVADPLGKAPPSKRAGKCHIHCTDQEEGVGKSQLQTKRMAALFYFSLFNALPNGKVISRRYFVQGDHCASLTLNACFLASKIGNWILLPYFHFLAIDFSCLTTRNRYQAIATDYTYSPQCSNYEKPGPEAIDIIHIHPPEIVDVHGWIRFYFLGERCILW